TGGDVLRLAAVVVAGSLLSGAVATEAGVRPCCLACFGWNVGSAGARGSANAARLALVDTVAIGALDGEAVGPLRLHVDPDTGVLAGDDDIGLFAFARDHNRVAHESRAVPAHPVVLAALVRRLPRTLLTL